MALSKNFKAGAIYSEEEYNTHAEFYKLLKDAGFETAGFEGKAHDRAYSGIYASPFVAFAETDQHKQAVKDIHAHNPQYAPGEVKNTGVTGGLDGLSQLFENQARDLPLNNTRVPAAQARQFLNANGYNLPMAEIS